MLRYNDTTRNTHHLRETHSLLVLVLILNFCAKMRGENEHTGTRISCY